MLLEELNEEVGVVAAADEALVKLEVAALEVDGQVVVLVH